jgi:4-hydroxy-2-oxoheptanedioate aldolase
LKTPVNAFKVALASGAPQYGLWLGLADPTCIEIAAGAGYDWLCMDAEHAPFDSKSLLVGLQVAAAYPTHMMVRVAEGSATTLKQVLDLGAQTIVVPMVESAEQARSLVAAARYPPRGIRGIGTAVARAARWNRTTDYITRADEEICLVLQVESQSGLDAMGAIAAVDGVDAIFIGPADLAASLGHPGDPGHREVRAAMRDAFARIRAAGKAAGAISADEALARAYETEGCNFLALGTDTGLLAAASSAVISRFRQR